MSGQPPSRLAPASCPFGPTPWVPPGSSGRRTLRQLSGLVLATQSRSGGLYRCSPTNSSRARRPAQAGAIGIGSGVDSPCRRLRGYHSRHLLPSLAQRAVPVDESSHGPCRAGSTARPSGDPLGTPCVDAWVGALSSPTPDVAATPQPDRSWNAGTLVPDSRLWESTVREQVAVGGAARLTSQTMYGSANNSRRIQCFT